MIIDPGVGHESEELAKELFHLIENRQTHMADGVLEVDPSVYTSATLAQQERETIFSEVPIMAAHGSELPDPHNFVRVQLPNNEVLLVRQEDGSVKALVNACRHRGAKVVTEDQGSQRVFSCRYHGWSYNPDGSLRNIPHGDTFGEVDYSCSGLVEVPCEVRHGFVWVVDAVGAHIDVADWLGPEIDESLGFYELDSYTQYRVGRFDEPINWKALMDAFVDAYHLATTHAKSVAAYFYNNVQIWEPMGRHGRSTTPRKSIDSIRHDAPGAEPLSKHITVAHFLMPNFTILRQPDHFETLSFMPHPTDPGRSRAEIRLLTKEGVSGAEEEAHWEKNWDIVERVLRDEDLALCRDLQHAAANNDTAALVFGRNEIANQHFHRWYRKAIDEPMAGA